MIAIRPPARGPTCGRPPAGRCPYLTIMTSSLLPIRGALGAALGAALLACGDGAGEPSLPADSVPPAVVELSPAPFKLDVPAVTVISARFSEPINPATVGIGSFLVRRGLDTVPGSYTHADSVATFVPEANLLPGASYSVALTRGIRDPAGNQLARDTSWSFRVATGGPPVGRVALIRRPYLTTLRTTNHTLAGRSASRRMYHRNHASP